MGRRLALFAVGLLALVPLVPAPASAATRPSLTVAVGAADPAGMTAVTLNWAVPSGHFTRAFLWSTAPPRPGREDLFLNDGQYDEPATRSATSEVLKFRKGTYWVQVFTAPLSGRAADGCENVYNTDGYLNDCGSNVVPFSVGGTTAPTTTPTTPTTTTGGAERPVGCTNPASKNCATMPNGTRPRLTVVELIEGSRLHVAWTPVPGWRPLVVVWDSVSDAKAASGGTAVLHGNDEAYGANGLKPGTYRIYVRGQLEGELFGPTIESNVVTIAVPAPRVNAGTTSGVRGVVEVQQADGTWKRIATGGVIRVNDRVRTGSDGRLVLRLLDETEFRLGPNSDLVIDDFVYSPSTRGGRIGATVTKGVFRWVTGKIAHPSADKKLKTPNGGGGIRGTDFVGRYDPNAQTFTIWTNSGLVTYTPNATRKPTNVPAGRTATFNRQGRASVSVLTAKEWMTLVATL